MINTNLPPVLHRFGDTCRGQSLRPLNWVLNFYYNYKHQWSSMQCIQSSIAPKPIQPSYQSLFCLNSRWIIAQMVNVHGSSMARCKARGRLPTSANWTFFASYHGWRARSRYWSKLRFLKGVWQFERKFHGERGVPRQRFLASEH